MSDQLISFELATLAKEKNMNYRSRKMYDRNNELQFTPDIKTVLREGGLEALKTPPQLFAPSLGFLHRRLREDYFIDVFVIDSIKENCYDWEIRREDDEPKIECDQYYHTYENALEAGLMEALKLL